MHFGQVHLLPLSGCCPGFTIRLLFADLEQLCRELIPTSLLPEMVATVTRLKLGLENQALLLQLILLLVDFQLQM